MVSDVSSPTSAKPVPQLVGALGRSTALLRPCMHDLPPGCQKESGDPADAPKLSAAQGRSQMCKILLRVPP